MRKEGLEKFICKEEIKVKESRRKTMYNLRGKVEEWMAEEDSGEITKKKHLLSYKRRGNCGETSSPTS